MDLIFDVTQLFRGYVVSDPLLQLEGAIRWPRLGPWSTQYTIVACHGSVILSKAKCQSNLTS
jgi:hypothetical protein